VESPDGVPLRGLEHKDFEVTIGGQHAEFFLRSVSIDPAPTNCVFLIDVSGSVAPVLPEVKAAVVNLAADLSRDKTNMKLITFGAEVNADQAWTIDPAIISQQVERLQAIGGTALYRGLNRAIDELVPRPSRERRAVILFTDGKNEDQDGRIGLDHVVDRLTANDISVYSVGLKTRDLDPLVLKRLAGKRGEFLEAANAAELPTRFTATSRALYRNRYRLVIPVNVERVEINDIKKLISFRFSGPLIVEVELPISK